VETREKILPIILEQTTDLLNADGCLLELIEPASGDSIVKEANGVFLGQIGFRVPLDKGLNSYIRETGQPYINNNVLNDPRILNEMAEKSCQASSGVPLIAQGQLIGFLWIARRIPISEKAVQTLSSIADIAANAIHRVDLFQQTQHRLDQLTSLRKIDAAINSNIELKDTLEVFINQTIDLLHVDAVQVMSYDTVSKTMNFLEGKGFSTSAYLLPHDVPANMQVGKLVSKLPTFQINDTEIMDYPQKNRVLVEGEGFRSFFITPLIVNYKLRGLLQVFLKQPFYPDADWIQFYETLAGQAAIAMNEAILWKDLQTSNIELQTAYDETLEGWSKALDLRDHETENHTQRVIELTLRLARKMGITGDEFINIRRGALLHDLGKIGVPDSILTKPGKLTPEEWEVMRRHPSNAYDLIYPIKYLRDALDIPYCHHEKWDGSGYPRGLKGEQIPLAARLFAFADVWDAMTSDRYYRAAMSVEEVTKYIRENSGKHFDPSIVEVFLAMDKK
jgi:HD-GYP domain-containing protein (c-di-GMP phosphodiesterase class II)